MKRKSFKLSKDDYNKERIVYGTLMILIWVAFCLLVILVR